MIAELVLAVAIVTAPAVMGPVAYMPIIQHTSGSTVVGRVAAVPEWWPTSAVIHVWLASYLPLSEDGESGVWILAPELAPQAVLESDGAFAIHAVPPGRYCILVGWDPAWAMLAVENEWDRADVFEVTKRQSLDLGTVILG